MNIGFLKDIPLLPFFVFLQYFRVHRFLQIVHAFLKAKKISLFFQIHQTKIIWRWLVLFLERLPIAPREAD